MNARPVLCPRRLLTPVAVLVVLTVSLAAEQATLQYRWTKGEDIAYRFAQEATTSMSGLSGGLGDVNIEMRTTQLLRTRVEDVTADGTATLNYSYQSARWEMRSPMGTVSYDTTATDNPPANTMSGPMRDMLTAMIGESFVVVMNRQGQVQKVEGMTRIIEKMFKGLPPNPELMAALEGLKNNLSDAGMRAAFAQGYSQFPDRPLEPGDTWETQSTMPLPMGGQLTARNTFTLKALEGRGADQVARITSRMTMKSDQSAGSIAPIGLKMEFGDSTGEGELTFAVAAGRLLGGSTRTVVPVSITRTGPDGNETKMQTIVKSTISIELVRP